MNANELNRLIQEAKLIVAMRPNSEEMTVSVTIKDIPLDVLKDYQQKNGLNIYEPTSVLPYYWGSASVGVTLQSEHLKSTTIWK